MKGSWVQVPFGAFKLKYFEQLRIYISCFLFSYFLLYINSNLDYELIDYAEEATAANGNNDFAYTATKAGRHMFVLFATGNNPSTSASCDTADINVLLDVPTAFTGGCGSLLIITTNLQVGDTVNMVIKNSGGNGYYRRYYVYG